MQQAAVGHLPERGVVDLDEMVSNPMVGRKLHARATTAASSAFQPQRDPFGRCDASRGAQELCTASATPVSVTVIAVASLQPRGSPNMRAAATTAISGTSSMPVDAITGGK